MRTGPHLFQRTYRSTLDLFLYVTDQVSDHVIEQALQRLVELQFFHDTGICVFGFVVETAKYRNACAYTFEGEQVSFVAIVQVSRVIGNLVRQIDQLSFQRRTLLEHILRKFRKLAGLIVWRKPEDALAPL